MHKICTHMVRRYVTLKITTILSHSMHLKTVWRKSKISLINLDAKHNYPRDPRGGVWFPSQKSITLTFGSMTDLSKWN